MKIYNYKQRKTKKEQNNGSNNGCIWTKIAELTENINNFMKEWNVERKEFPPRLRKNR